MAFTFIHTADWQLGKPFRNFEARLGGLLDEARFEAIDRIAEIAKARAAGHVLVAGDIFDDRGVDNRIVRRAIERLGRHHGLTWHLLPGNHDFTQPAGLWQRFARLGAPVNVTVHEQPRVAEIAPGVALLPAPLTGRLLSEDPTAWMDGAATEAGVIRIGLAHGSIQDFGEEGESAVRLDPARSRKARLDYLALGDWHGMQRIDERTWYSGTPEPDRFAANEPGHVLCVRIEAAGGAVSAEPVRCARYMWVTEAAELSRADDLHVLAARLAKAADDPGRVLARVALSGALPPGDIAAIEPWGEALAARLRHIEIDDGAVTARTGSDDLGDMAGSGAIGAAARILEGRLASADPGEASLAQGALVRLIRFARRVREAAP